MARLLYDDGVYRVTSAVLATPSRFYPIANTTASLRRDPLWLGLALGALTAVSFRLYGDLLLPGEKIMLAGLSLGAIILGCHIVILRIAAPGHRRAILIGRRQRMRRLYEAIWRARTADVASITIGEDHDV